MKRILLATMMVACAAPGFASSEAPVSEYVNDPSYRSPLLTSPVAIALEQFFAQMRERFTAQSSIAPFKAGAVGSRTQAVRSASVLSSSSRERASLKLKIDAIAPMQLDEVQREAKKLHASVEIGSSLDTPWDAWENRETAVTDEYR